MNERIDVLAVMDAAIGKANAKASGPTRFVQIYLHEATAISAAVGELDIRACAALELLEELAPTHPRTAKLRDALARVQGGAK